VSEQSGCEWPGPATSAAAAAAAAGGRGRGARGLAGRHVKLVPAARGCRAACGGLRICETESSLSLTGSKSDGILCGRLWIRSVVQKFQNPRPGQLVKLAKRNSKSLTNLRPRARHPPNTHGVDTA
jgi:hypothetical protein